MKKYLKRSKGLLMNSTFVIFYIVLFITIIYIDKNRVFNTDIRETPELSILYTSILSIGGLAFTYVQTRGMKYSDIVTKSRLDWISSVRNEVEIFFTLVVDQENKIQKLKKHGGSFKKMSKESIFNGAENKEFKAKFLDNSSKIKASVNNLTLYFNPDSENDREIVNQISEISLYVSKKNYLCNDEKTFKQMCDKLTRKLSVYLKTEWDRIKYESR